MKQADLNSKVSITKDFFQNSLFNFQGPARDIRGYSSAGRAPALQAGGHRFDPVCLHHTLQIKAKAKAKAAERRQQTSRSETKG